MLRKVWKSWFHFPRLVVPHRQINSLAAQMNGCLEEGTALSLRSQCSLIFKRWLLKSIELRSRNTHEPLLPSFVQTASCKSKTVRCVFLPWETPGEHRIFHWNHPVACLCATAMQIHTDMWQVWLCSSTWNLLPWHHHTPPNSIEGRGTCAPPGGILMLKMWMPWHPRHPRFPEKNCIRNADL